MHLVSSYRGPTREVGRTGSKPKDLCSNWPWKCHVPAFSWNWSSLGGQDKHVLGLGRIADACAPGQRRPCGQRPPGRVVRADYSVLRPLERDHRTVDESRPV